MADVIDFNNPFANLYKQIEEKDAEIKRLAEDNIRLGNKLATLAGTNDILKLQILDLVATLNQSNQVNQKIIANLQAMLTKLPTI